MTEQPTLERPQMCGWCKRVARYRVKAKQRAEENTQTTGTGVVACTSHLPRAITSYVMPTGHVDVEFLR